MKTLTTSLSFKVLMVLTVVIFILGVAMIDSAGAEEK